MTNTPPPSRSESEGLAIGHGSRGVFEDRRESGSRRFALKRASACRHLVKNDPDGKDVGAVIDCLSLYMLGGHVVHRPDDHSLGCLRHRRKGTIGVASGKRTRWFCEPKVEHLGSVRAPDSSGRLRDGNGARSVAFRSLSPWSYLEDRDSFATVSRRRRGLDTARSGVEQRSARQAHNLEVAGSNPASATSSVSPVQKTSPRLAARRQSHDAGYLHKVRRSTSRSSRLTRSASLEQSSLMASRL